MGHFFLQSVFNTTKWCRRRLTKKEVATAFDVPHQVLELCTAAELDLLPKYPGRTLEHCAKSLLAHEGLIDQGGGSVASGRNRVCEDAGVGKSEEKIEEQELQTVGEPHKGDPPLASTKGEGTQGEDKRLGAGNEPELEPPEPELPPKDLSAK
jgi:hypothetical protein